MSLSNEVRVIWADAYRLMEAHSGMAGTESDWDKLAEVQTELYNKHDGSRLALDLILAAVDEIERMVARK